MPDINEIPLPDWRAPVRPRQVQADAAHPVQVAPVAEGILRAARARLDELRAEQQAVNLQAQDAAIRGAAQFANPEDWLFQPMPAVVEKAKKKEPSTVAEYWGLRPPTRVAKAMASHPGSIIKGIELEIENFPVGLEEAEATGFSFVADGSLRNNGVEAVSFPNNTAGILAVTKALWSKYGITENNFSDRTSIHVHANVLDFSLEQYKAVTLLYQVFEELIFDFVGNERADNIYCVPWYDAGLTAANHNRIFERPRQWQKYTALNLQPTCEKGTIEFRHMHGHANPTLLTAWLALIDDLCLSAKNGSYTELMQSIKDINTTSQYHQLLVRNFPNSYQLLMVNNWEKKLSRGVVEAKLSLE